jgi:hypothetical protein
MELAAESRPCVEYLMGNHVFAQRMFRHDPSVMLYAPLRTAIYVDHDDRTWFTIDQTDSARFRQTRATAEESWPDIKQCGVWNGAVVTSGALAVVLRTVGSTHD